ncbi:hypothetical protein Hypma_005598 [Hypsizygus marmoreus]|uniref:Uncharacterized protein n=1 Tax=Hypsizygus marmoreus TaxID=39966 RepID=A0A369JZA7_HYPMA|nr:hypothetical protein Hypma_005598 [Hypsizygus marmoreus]
MLQPELQLAGAQREELGDLIATYRGQEEALRVRRLALADEQEVAFQIASSRKALETPSRGAGVPPEVWELRMAQLRNMIQLRATETRFLEEQILNWSHINIGLQYADKQVSLPRCNRCI